jgi:diguanylate cyclase (GGDEF)-like protein
MAAVGGAGLHAVSLLFEASTLWVLARYSGLHETRPRLARRNDFAVGALVLAAALVVALRDSIPVVMDYLIPLLWVAGMVAAVAMVADALVRRVPMAAAIATAVAILVGTVIVAELTWRGVIVDSFATYYAYQMATVLSSAMLAVGLISRISRYREQRDREQRARADTERRMYREAVRSELLTALQVSLRGREESEVLPVAFTLLLEHLRRIVPSHSAVLVARGYHGADAVVAHPPVMQARAESEMAARTATLRHQLAGSVETQRPVARDDSPGGIAMEALVALPIRAPSWGVILVERYGSTPFHPDELAIARELARLASLQIDEAYSALHLRRTAEVDALTGLLNRRSLEQALVRSSHHAHRGGHALSVLYIDLDHFKPINDQHGHACGDHCLRAVSQVLQAAVGEDGLVGRWGGEEFLAVLPGLGTEAARAVAEGMRTAVEAADLVWQERPLRLTVSIGVASQLPHEGQHGPAVERADAALYAAKRAGRNRVNAAPAVFQTRPASA